jgi:multimeric flavodoxin WrbA
VVVLNGSPRKDGNTAALLKRATEDHASVDLKYFDLWT